MKKLGIFAGVCAALGLLYACGGSDDAGLGKGTGGQAGAAGAGGSNSDGSAGSGGAAGNAGAAGSGGAAGNAGAGGQGGAGGACPDNDNDGQTTCAGDCDDSDPLTYNGAPEVCGDGKDNDCDNTPDNGCSGIGTYVSANTGSDSNPGTQASPVKTIAKGMQNAQTIGGTQIVFVGEGHYTEKVTLVEGISIYGGYQCDTTSCTWTRDFKKYDSAIFGTDHEGTVATDAITRATKLDGLRLMGANGGGTANGRAALSIKGGSPTVSNNKIIGPNTASGNWQSGRSYGIAIVSPTKDPKGPLIDSNDVTSGVAAEGSNAISLDAWNFPSPGPTYAEIVNNVIQGGQGKSANGIAGWTAGKGTIVARNRITAGTASTGSAFAITTGGTMDIDSNRINVATTTASCAAGNLSYCGGIGAWSASGSITNNVIFGIDAPRSAGIMLMEAEVPAGVLIINGNLIDGGGASASGARSTAIAHRIGTCNTCGFNGINGRIRNNILLGGTAPNRYGVYEDGPTGKTTHPEFLENNVFFISNSGSVTGSALYRLFTGATGQNLTTIAAVNALGTTTPGMTTAANQDADPKVDGTFHLQSGSPCIDKGTATEAPPKDFEGDTRPKGSAVDVGPDEM